MVVLSGLIHLPRYIVLGLGVVIVADSNLLDGLFPTSNYPNPDPLWLGLHREIMWVPFGIKIDLWYPLLSWSGLMACGYGLASVFSWKPEQRQRFLLSLGGGLLALFFVLRFLNLYGDPYPWQPGNGLKQSIESFLNLEKYPPSLLYLSATLGLVFPLLALKERCRLPLHDAIVTFGRVPFFFYVIHIYVIHLLTVIAGVLQGFPASALLVDVEYKPEGFGFGLPVVYLVWISVVIVLYPACRWFAGIKANRNYWWLSYL